MKIFVPLPVRVGFNPGMEFGAQFTEEGFFGRHGAAGCIVLAQSTGRILLSKRSKHVSEPHTWATWGGAIEHDCSPERTTADELFEEAGYDRAMVLEKLCRYSSPGGFFYQNFLAIVPDEFIPWDSHENEDFAWVDFGAWPQNLHFGLKHLLDDAPSLQHIADRVLAVKAGQDFINGTPHPERTLYHALYKTPQGNALLPLSDRVENGKRSLYLYATHSFSKAMAYAFSYHSGEICANGLIQGTPDEFAIVCRRMLDDKRLTRIFNFSSRGFAPVGGCPSVAQQWVSEKPQPFAQAALCYQTGDIHELMRRGLQIISVDMTAPEFTQAGLAAKYLGMPGANENMLAALIRDGIGRWENRERTHPNGHSSLRPNRKIQAALDALNAAGPREPGPAP